MIKISSFRFFLVTILLSLQTLAPLEIALAGRDFQRGSTRTRNHNVSRNSNINRSSVSRDNVERENRNWENRQEINDDLVRENREDRQDYRDSDREDRQDYRDADREDRQDYRDDRWDDVDDWRDDPWDYSYDWDNWAERRFWYGVGVSLVTLPRCSDRSFC